MNVLFVATTLHRGGAEMHLLLLARGLRAHGITAEVAFLRADVAGGSVDLRETFEREGIRTHYLGSERFYDPRAAVRLHRLLRSRQWDVVHSHLPRADAAAATCKLLMPRQVWISTLHHPYDDSAYSAAALIPVLAPMWRLANGVIAVSEPVREWAIRRLRLNAGTVRTVVHGVGPDAPDASEFTPPGACCVGSIGRYEARKGHETLIRAMVPLLREFPHARLKIAGHDPWGHGAVLRGLIAELGLQQHVDLVGFTDDKRAFFVDVDVFAFASRSEGFGIVVIEAMHAGKPVVVSDISPLRDIINPGHSGLVAEPDNPDSFAAAIGSLFRNRADLARIGDEARRRVEAEFSYQRMIERTIAFYRDVTAATPVRAAGASHQVVP